MRGDDPVGARARGPQQRAGRRCRHRRCRPPSRNRARAGRPRGRPAGGRAGARPARPGSRRGRRARRAVPAASSSSRRAAAGEHRDADGIGGERALDVVHVVADVDRGALARSTSALPTPHTSPSSRSTSSARWSRWSWALGAYLPVTTTTRPRVASYGGERLVRARQHRHRGDRVVGVERPEAVDGRLRSTPPAR